TVFDICRLNAPSPFDVWARHAHALSRRCEQLNDRAYVELRYRGPGTDLRVGLPSGCRWECVRTTPTSGITFMSNIPSDDVVTLPRRARGNGTVQTTRPVELHGVLIDGVSLSFTNGQLTGLRAGQGQSILEKLVAADDGATRLGEVALVPHGSPVSRTGLVFY